MGIYGKYPLEMDVLYGFIWKNHGNIWGYPLVIWYIAIENGYLVREFSHEKMWIFP